MSRCLTIKMNPFPRSRRCKSRVSTLIDKVIVSMSTVDCLATCFQPHFSIFLPSISEDAETPPQLNSLYANAYHLMVVTLHVATFLNQTVSCIAAWYKAPIVVVQSK